MSVTCSRSRFLLFLSVFWAGLTLYHLASPDDVVSMAGIVRRTAAHTFSLYAEQPSQQQGALAVDASAEGAVSLSNLHRSLLAAFKAVPAAPLPACNFSSSSPTSLYSFTAATVDRSDVGPGVSVTISLACIPDSSSSSSSSSAVSPRAAFRVHTTGVSMTALPPAVLQPGRSSLSVFVRVPDAGEHSLHVKLMLYNASDDLTHKTYPGFYKLKDEEVRSRWLDAPILRSPFNFTMRPSAFAQHVPVPYELLNSTAAASASRLPLCNSVRSHNGSLAGRWLLGPRHAHISHQWWSDSLFDDYAALWSPFECRLDYTASLLQALRQVRWLNIVGDSNMRALFGRLCELAGGTAHHGEPSLGYMDLPKLCLIDGGETVLTFSNWFVGKLLPLYAGQRWEEQCARYNDSLAAIKLHNTVFGWPECRRAAASIQQMQRPGLLYFGWGSHAAEIGAEDSYDFFRSSLMTNDYFRYVPTVFALTEDVDSSLIPDKFGSQFVYRNNERIAAVNAQLGRMVADMWQRWPIDMLADDGKTTVAGWHPVLDVFSPTHAASEVLHGDAVHFWGETEMEIAKWLTHWITHAPQVNPRLTRKVRPWEQAKT